MAVPPVPATPTGAGRPIPTTSTALGGVRPPGRGAARRAARRGAGQRWAAVDADVADVFATMAELLLAPAKRLRPSFCYWGYVGAGGEPDDARPVDAGAAFELLHAFALFHDDVMDGSAVRRGQPHVPPRLRRPPRGRRLDGRGPPLRRGRRHPRRRPRLRLRRRAASRDAPGPAWDVWNELRVELNVGQYLDILGTARRARDPATAERIARYKSGKYTRRAAAARRRPAGRARPGRRAGAGAVRLRPAPRRRLPAPRRHARRVRRRAGDRQARRRRPPRGQAHAAAGARPSARADARQRRVLAGVGEPDLGAGRRGAPSSRC